MQTYGDNIGIELESIPIKKLILNNVNNFLLVDGWGNVKEKGLFERYETIVKQKMYWKDTSASIIPEALYQFFINGVPVENTINNCNNIFDFLIGVKGSGSSHFQFMESISTDNVGEPYKILVPYRGEIRDINNSDNKNNNNDTKKQQGLSDTRSTMDNSIHRSDVYGNRFGYSTNHPELMAFKLVTQSVDKNTKLITNKYHKLRMMRYYIAHEGSTLFKNWSSDSKKGYSFDSVEATSPVRLANSIRKAAIKDFKKDGVTEIVKYHPTTGVKFERYPSLNREWYINKAKEIIKNII